MAKELPEMDTGKVVLVQDGEEYVASNSMAASGEESEEETRAAAIAAAGASYLHPLVLEDSESYSEDQTWINHLPEGSLLHAVYFHLLGAGFDRMKVRELFRSRVVRTWKKLAFEKPVAALAEPEMEFEERHQSMGDMQMPSRVGEQLRQQSPQQMPESVPRRHRVGAKKATEIVRPSNFQGPSWPRTTRPSPPVKKNKGCLKNTRPLPPVKKNIGHLKNRFQGMNWPRTTRPLPPVKKNKGYLKNRLQGTSEPAFPGFPMRRIE